MWPSHTTLSSPYPNRIAVPMHPFIQRNCGKWRSGPSSRASSAYGALAACRSKVSSASASGFVGRRPDWKIGQWDQPSGRPKARVQLHVEDLASWLRRWAVEETVCSCPRTLNPLPRVQKQSFRQKSTWRSCRAWRSELAAIDDHENEETTRSVNSEISSEESGDDRSSCSSRRGRYAKNQAARVCHHAVSSAMRELERIRSEAELAAALSSRDA